MPNIKSVLCPLDFSDASRHALDHAIAVAGWYSARLVGLHVYTPEFVSVPGLATPVDYAGQLPPDPAALDQLREEVVACLEPARAAGLTTDARVGTGAPAAAILTCAAAIASDLIVIGTHGAGGFEHLVLGSVTEKVLRKATCPVLTVPPRARATSRLPFKRLLCPIDFSDPSLGALELALSIAQEADAQLTILHVLEWPIEEEPLSNRAFNVPEYGAYREQDAASRLARLLPDGAGNWCTATTRIARGKPYREILGVATEDRADLIVMGVHGRNALDVMLFGSTTNQVVRRATCPVLTLRRR